MSDYLDEAMEKEYSLSSTFFGHLTADVYPCVLVKGMGKVGFNPQIHSADQRRLAITLSIQPLARPDGTVGKPYERNLIAESKEWANVTKVSLTKISSSLKAANGKYVQVKLVPTGGKFTGKDGAQRDETAFSFEAIYDSVEACQQAASTAGRGDGAAAQPTVPPPPDANAERELALSFLPALWNSASKDRAQMEKFLTNNSIVNKHFQIDSPEVVAIMGDK